MPQPSVSPKTGGATPRMPNVPSHLTREISNFDQFQERIQALVNEYNLPLVGGFGPIVVPHNGGTAYTWGAQLHTPLGGGMMHLLASDNGPILEKCINRVLEDAAYTLAAQKGQAQPRRERAVTSGQQVKTGT